MRLFMLSMLAIVFFASCVTPRYSYSPSAHNVPVFTQQGDSKIGINYSTNLAANTTDDDANKYDKNVSHGVDLQGAYAITNNIAVQASYYHRSEKSNISSSDLDEFAISRVKYKRNLFEIGAGFYTPLDSRQRVYFQAYLGGGLGKTNISDNGTDQLQLPYSRYYDANLSKFFVEPSVTFRAKEIFAGTITSRVSVMKFRNIHTNYSLNEKQRLDLDSLDRYSVVFFEPAFVGSVGFNKLPGLRIEFQAGLSILYDQDFLDYRPFNFSLGLVFDIRKLVNAGNKPSN